MKQLQNFGLGALVAAVLMGPVAWASAEKVAVRTGTLVSAAINGPARSGIETVHASVRAAILPKS